MSMPSIVRGCRGQLQHSAQSGEPLLRIDEEHFGLCVRVEFTALVERLEHVDFIAQPGRPLELQVLRGRLHLLTHLCRAAFACSPLRNICSRWMSRRYSSLPIRRLHGAVHWLMLASRQGRNHRHRSSPSSMSRLQVRNLKIRCSTCTAPRSEPALAKRPVQLDSPVSRLARDLHAREILARRDHQVRKGLVVLLFLVVLAAECP